MLWVPRQTRQCNVVNDKRNNRRYLTKLPTSRYYYNIQLKDSPLSTDREDVFVISKANKLWEQLLASSSFMP
jgi:hypothetical protein